MVSKGRSEKMAYARKSIDVTISWVKENLSQYMEYIESSKNTADIFTKPLDKVSFCKHRDTLGIAERSLKH